MSISKGGQSVKPYVGSKEVKEAYVGSQLVYRAVPPVYYAFLGSENSYELAPWASIAPSNTTIVKDGGIYRVQITGAGGGIAGSGFLSLNEIKAPVLRFTRKNYGLLDIVGITNNGQRILKNYGAYVTGWSLETVTIPADIVGIKFQKSADAGITSPVYLDAVRLENE